MELLLIVILVAWFLGFFGSFSPYRGNSMLHALLVIFFIILIVEWLGGGNHLLYRHWHHR